MCFASYYNLLISTTRPNCKNLETFVSFLWFFKNIYSDLEKKDKFVLFLDLKSVLNLSQNNFLLPQTAFRSDQIRSECIISTWQKHLRQLWSHQNKCLCYVVCVHNKSLVNESLIKLKRAQLHSFFVSFLKRRSKNTQLFLLTFQHFSLSII